VQTVDDIRRLMPLLERRRAESGLDDKTAARLVEEVVCRPWSDYWVGFALDWIDTGIWSDKIADGLRAITQDKQFSQATRHRAWRYAKTESEAGW
jgi:hypothetical protein